MITGFFPWWRKTLHNIYPGQGYSLGGRYIIVRVYNQESLHECKYRGFTTRCKPLATLYNWKIRLCQKTSICPEYSSMAESVNWPQPNWAGFSVTEEKPEERKTQKQVATEGGCSKDLAKYLRGVNLTFVDVQGFQTSSSHWRQKGFSYEYWK